MYCRVFIHSLTEEKPWLRPQFGNHEESSYKPLRASFCVDVFSAPLGKYQGTHMLGCTIRVFQFYKKLPHCLPRGSSICIPTRDEWRVLLLWCPECFWMLTAVIHCVVASCFNLLASSDAWCEACLFAAVYISFYRWDVCLVLLLFFINKQTILQCWRLNPGPHVR